MTPADRWIRKMGRELTSLVAQDRLEDADAYRALVLLARLRDAAGSSVEPAEVQLGRGDDDFCRAVLETCMVPTPEEILDELGELLADEAPTIDQLHMLLLDVDDLCGVLGLLGDTAQAAETADLGAAFVSIRPVSVVRLGQFAAMRLDTLGADMPIARLWSEVCAAPAHVLANALPGTADEAVVEILVQDLLEDASGGAAMVEIPFTLGSAVAAATTVNFESVVDHEGKVRGERFVDKGDLFYNHRLAEGVVGTPTAHLVVRDKDSQLELSREPLPAERDGRDLRVLLGPASGENGIAARLELDLGRPLDELEITIVVNE